MITDEVLNFYDMLTQECLVLNDVEERLREKGDVGLLQELIQFQKDAAIEVQWVICGGKDTTEGKAIDDIWKTHQQIMPQRYSVFTRVAEALKGHELEVTFLAIVGQIPEFDDKTNPRITMTREI